MPSLRTTSWASAIVVIWIVLLGSGCPREERAQSPAPTSQGVTKVSSVAETWSLNVPSKFIITEEDLPRRTSAAHITNVKSETAELFYIHENDRDPPLATVLVFEKEDEQMTLESMYEGFISDLPEGSTSRYSDVEGHRIFIINGIPSERGELYAILESNGFTIEINFTGEEQDLRLLIDTIGDSLDDI